ncbi:MAG: hypothetical protein MUC84_11060 [Solirubrobacteraceae bacterium]|jgi:hypothetical protein|nr:hypothetical protein [Solirubrobacteraceae bacterium]
MHPVPHRSPTPARRPPLWRRTHGQGTVEYVALILLVAGVLAGVITAAGGLKGGGIAQTVVGKMKQTIEQVGGRQG